MGIVEQISEGTTYFRGSTRERVQNIVTAANKLRGVVIPPGEEFSFNKRVGDVTAANGFVDSLIIRGDRTETGVGGGVCQVSTTVFRAAFWGGYPVLERYPHGYVVSWYGEPGLDASIFTPDVDFRFRNDTGSFLLIQPEVDTAKGRITFYFYGTLAHSAEAEQPVSPTSARRPGRFTRKTHPGTGRHEADRLGERGHGCGGEAHDQVRRWAGETGQVREQVSPLAGSFPLWAGDAVAAGGRAVMGCNQ